MFIIPDAFKHMEDQLTLTSYISNPVTGFICSTIEMNSDIIDMLRTNGLDICAPFDSWQITAHGKIRFTKNDLAAKLKEAKPWVNRIHPGALKEISSRNRGWYEPKPYPRFLELSQPKEKSDDETY